LWAEQAVCFSAGVLASHFCLSEKYDKNNFRYFISAFFGCLLLAASAFAIRHHLPGFYVFNNICWLVFKTSLAIAVILATQFVKTSYTTKLFGYIGKYSFAVYLIHLYIFEIIFKYSFTPITIALAFVIIAVLSIVYTILINKLYTSVKRRMKNEQT
jgi:peptidoglycan/LPS O-acetylase OafA/YrhL